MKYVQTGVKYSNLYLIVDVPGVLARNSPSLSLAASDKDFVTAKTIERYLIQYNYYVGAIIKRSYSTNINLRCVSSIL